MPLSSPAKPPNGKPHRPQPLFENSPMFRMALDQLNSVPLHTHIDPGILNAWQPETIHDRQRPDPPRQRRRGVVYGFRVQHSLTSGPSKGGLRYHPSVTWAKSRPGHVDVVEMRIMNLPFGGAKGGIAVDPGALRRGERERLTRRFTEEILSIIGHRIDVMAPTLGPTNRRWPGSTIHTA